MVFAQAMIVARKHSKQKHTPTPTTDYLRRWLVASDLHPCFDAAIDFVEFCNFLTERVVN